MSFLQKWPIYEGFRGLTAIPDSHRLIPGSGSHLNHHIPQGFCPGMTKTQGVHCAVSRKVDVRVPGKVNSNSHGARPVHLIITMIKWIRTSRLSINNSVSLHCGGRGWIFGVVACRSGCRDGVLLLRVMSSQNATCTNMPGYPGSDVKNC